MDYLFVTAGQNITNPIAKKLELKTSSTSHQRLKSVKFSWRYCKINVWYQVKKSTWYVTWIVKIFKVNIETLVHSALHFHQYIILGVIDYYLTPKHQFFIILSTSALKARFCEKWGYGTCRVKIEPLNSRKVHRKPYETDSRHNDGAKEPLSVA